MQVYIENLGISYLSLSYHQTSVPCYYHNYLLGQMLASQLYYTIGEKILGSLSPENESFTGKPEAGKYLIDKVFMPGTPLFVERNDRKSHRQKTHCQILCTAVYEVNRMIEQYELKPFSSIIHCL